jgi:hypothetical protein
MRRFFATTMLVLLTSNAFAARGSGGTKAHTRSSETYSNSYSSAEYNARFAPISLLVGALDVSFDVKIMPDWTVGPKLRYAKASYTLTGSSFEVTAFNIGARANWFKNGAFTDGLYVGPSVAYYSAKASGGSLSSTATAEASGLMIGALVGYGWFWQSFNQMLGIGLNTGLGDMKIKAQDNAGSYTEVSAPMGGLDIEYSLGWTF